MYEGRYPYKRYRRTLAFITTHIPRSFSILDLGVDNPFSEILRTEGYQVSNTSGEDLDLDRSAIENSDAEVVTALEILEHLLSPFEVLKSIPSDAIVVSVPLRLWFARAYRSTSDHRDRHFHEFEKWQFDWLLEKAGWEIKASDQWTNPVKKIGIRPLLRLFTPRYYIVYATRKS